MILAGVAVTGAAAFALAWHCLPFPADRLQRWPASPMVTDRTGKVLLSRVGRDEQWRFPVPLDRISPWLVTATLATEDGRFRQHVGVDPVAAARAAVQNMRARRVVSGASTLTMQVCRMMDDRPRNFRAKILEAFRAMQLERLRGKDEILEFYLNVAPYGGNLRGAEAAARVYFQKPAADLSLGEAALLAGLPQSPSRYRPDRFPEQARARRGHVLRRMLAQRLITPAQLALATSEPVPGQDPSQAPSAKRGDNLAPHAAWMALQRRPAGGRTTIDSAIQRELAHMVADYTRKLPTRTQIATVVIDIAQSEIVGLVGSSDPTGRADGQNNGAIARRSPGSTLKPFIYAAAFEAGCLAPDSIVYDVPIDRGGWTPVNFNRGFFGPLTASEALRRSLNIPAILVAEGVGLPRCVGIIETAGIHLPRRVQERAGLGIVVGSAEVTLLELVNGYATLGRSGVHSTPRLLLDEPVESARALEPNTCAVLNDILSSRRRRPRGMELLSDADVPAFMWKTGTSSGQRDAWAVGHNWRYAIGVWVGRFSGASDRVFVGAEAAEPLLASLFNLPRLRGEAPNAAPLPMEVTQPLSPPAEAAALAAKWESERGGKSQEAREAGARTPSEDSHNYGSESPPLRILSPSDSARLVAVDDKVTVHVRASREDDLVWFINGVQTSEGGDQRLRLAVGSYEIRCVDSAGQTAAVRVNVLESPSRPTRTASALVRPNLGEGGNARP